MEQEFYLKFFDIVGDCELVIVHWIFSRRAREEGLLRTKQLLWKSEAFPAISLQPSAISRIHMLKAERCEQKAKLRTAFVFCRLLSNVAPPDPIPNSEVKRVSANNTCF